VNHEGSDERIAAVEANKALRRIESARIGDGVSGQRDDDIAARGAELSN